MQAALRKPRAYYRHGKLAPDALVGLLPRLRLTDVPADLLLVAAAREVTDPHSRPTQLPHQPGQTSKRAGRALALRHLEHVQHCLAAYPFLAIEIDLASDALQRGQPRVGGLFKLQALCS
jgi:hypothetical protein